ncbi:MAG: hypothetical protein ACKN9V_05520, partial [Pseudomonadota bacterium]
MVTTLAKKREKWIASSALMLWPFLYLSTTINDDAFVYYTYVKNLAQGNFFAYDPRGIPSEGFTSILYTLLLVPFELLQIPLPLAALLINIVTMLGVGCVSVKIFEQVFERRSDNSWLVAVCFLFFVYLDQNITVLMGWGLETLVNVFVFFLLIHRSIVLFNTKKQADFGLLLCFYFLGILIRPENVLIGFPWVGLGFSVLASKKNGIRSLVVLGAVTVMFFFWKYHVFGDVVPTGFYRKISARGLDFSYLVNYLREYSLVFHPLYWIMVISVMLRTQFFKSHRPLQLAGLGLVLTWAALVAFIVKVNPIQGYLQRYLTVGTLVSYLVGSIFFVFIIPRLRIIQLLMTSIVVIILFGGVRQRQRSNPLALYQETRRQLDGDPYVAFGKYLQKHIKKPEEVSLMFGDAGSIPYFFNCKFIDINGLTEPYLAKLFRDPKKSEKVAQYISNQKLDMAVLAVENNWINLKKDSQSLPQGPLNKPREYAYLLRRMKADGFVYGGTLHASSYDLHFGLNRQSPRFSELKKVLSDYISTGKGFVKESSLIV